jgi:hypothetical protein
VYIVIFYNVVIVSPDGSMIGLSTKNANSNIQQLTFEQKGIPTMSIRTIHIRTKADTYNVNSDNPHSNKSQYLQCHLIRVTKRKTFFFFLSIKTNNSRENAKHLGALGQTVVHN